MFLNKILNTHSLTRPYTIKVHGLLFCLALTLHLGQGPLFAQVDTLPTLEVDFKAMLRPAFPDSGLYQMAEDFKDEAGIAHQATFDWYVTQNYHTTGITYPKSKADPQEKRILFSGLAENIWTLKSKEGRLRKKSYTQRIEPMNVSFVHYWDYFLTPLINPFFKVTEKKTRGDTTVVYKVIPDEKCYYKKITVVVQQPESKLLEMNLMRNGNQTETHILFEYLPTPNQGLIHKIHFKNLKTGAESTWTIKKYKPSEPLPKIFKEGESLF